jgi:alginate O-acetyltransferase complex protein AlgI
MICSIMLNYGAGLLIGNAGFSVSKRKVSLALGVSLNVLILFYFKYLGFSEHILNSILKITHISEFQFTTAKIVLPLGISFYTFQSISYLMDVYRTPALVQKNILNLGLFISFFPQLIAGPIVRYHDINEQIKERKHRFDIFVQGVERFIIGLAKKVLIANTLAEYVDGILRLQYAWTPSVYLLLAVISGALQLYYDFSGYSDMAIGMGRMFGFHILENFDYPFISKTPTEFWRRWHISLSSWFRDYLYIPLGGNRKGFIRQIINLLIVYSLVGLWHGAEFHFIVFGLMSGAVIVLEKSFQSILNKLYGKGKAASTIRSILAHIIALSYTVCIFMFFRLNIKDGLDFYCNLLDFTRKIPLSVDLLLLADTRFSVFFACGLAFSFPWWRKLHIPINGFTTALKYALLIVLLVLSIGRLATDAYNPFLYFRF